MSKRIFCLFFSGFLALLFTACESDTLDEQQQDLTLNDENTVDESIFQHFVPAPTSTDFSRDIQTTLEPNLLVQRVETTSQEAISRTQRSRTKARNYDSSSASSSSKSRGQEEYEKALLKCGRSISSTLKNTPYVSTPNLYDNDDFYPDFGLSTNLDGTDRSFYLEIDREKIVTINLTHANRNLALLLFKGTVTPGADNIEEMSDKLVTFSTSNSRSREQLGPVRLMPGQYILVVDSRPHQASDFKLSMHCQSIHEGCDNGLGSPLIADRLEHYRRAGISPQSVYWEKWSPQKGRDGQVAFGYSNDQDLLFESDTDLLLCLGERTSGSYRLRFNMWIPDEAKAYMDVQKVLTFANKENEFGAVFNFHGRGHASLKVANHTTNFQYRTRRWMACVLDVDIDRNQSTFYLDGHRIHRWSVTDTKTRRGSGAKQIEAMSFAAPNNAYAFLVDNICFTQK